VLLSFPLIISGYKVDFLDSTISRNSMPIKDSKFA